MNSNEIFEYNKAAHTPTELLDHPSYSHSRYHAPWASNPGSLGNTTVYFRCSDSPSGVLAAGGFSMTPENTALLSARKIRANLGPSRGDIAAANLCGTRAF